MYVDTADTDQICKLS